MIISGMTDCGHGTILHDIRTMNNPHTPASIWRNPVHFVAFGLGIGAVGFAPGTWGTVLAVPLYILLQDLASVAYVAAVCVFFIAGVWICDVTTRDIGVKDHPGIVFDEIVGFLVTMTAVPNGWLWLIYGFLLFRLFDIWKPWPIRAIDRHMHGGTGIMLDDVIAGVFSCAVIHLTDYIVRIGMD
jgi:phosphatidylglycerophosphatase A